MTPFDRLIRRACAGWAAWRAQQRRYRECPQLRLIDAEEQAARAAHRPVRHIQKQRQAIVTAMLRGRAVM